MFSRCLALVMLAALLLPVRAHADPVTIPTHFIGAGAGMSVPAALPSRGGAIRAALPPRTPLRVVAGMSRSNAAQSSVAITVRGQVPRSDYMMELIVHGADSAWTTMKAELSGSPGGPGNNDGSDAQLFHAGVADGFSTAGDSVPGLQNSGLVRSAAFAGGGSASISLNAKGNAAEVVIASGLAGAPGIQIAFGLNDFPGGRAFLVTFNTGGSTPDDTGVSSTPEPTSMLLMGTGLAGLAAIRRRRSAAR